MALLEFFSSLWKLTLKEPLAHPLSITWQRGQSSSSPGWVSFSLCSVQQALKNHICWGLFSIGQLQCWHVGREPTRWRLPPPCGFSSSAPASMAAWHSSKGIPHYGFSPPHTLQPFPHSQQLSTLELPSNAHAPTPSHHMIQWTCIHVPGTQDYGIDYLCGSHSIQTVTDQLLNSALDTSLCSNGLPQMQEYHPVSAPHSHPTSSPPTPSAGPVPLYSPSFSLPSFILLRFPWIYIFFPVVRDSYSIQLVLCEICILGVFQMHPWRERCSTSTYCSTIFSPSSYKPLEIDKHIFVCVLWDHNKYSLIELIFYMLNMKVTIFRFQINLTNCSDVPCSYF